VEIGPFAMAAIHQIEALGLVMPYESPHSFAQ